MAALQQAKALAQTNIGDVNWQTYQLELELNRFDNGLLDFLRGQASAGTVELRLDILASRIQPVYQQGSVQANPAAMQALTSLSHRIDTWSTLIAGLEANGKQAKITADQLQRDVHQAESAVLSLNIHQAQSLRFDKVRLQLYHRFNRLSAIFGLLGLGVMLFLAILLAKIRKERHLSAKLYHLNSGLELKISERTRALHEQMTRLNTILEASPVGVALLEAETHRISFSNKALSRLLGWSNAQINAMPLRGMFAKPDDEQIFWNTLEETGQVIDMEAELMGQGGAFFGALNAKCIITSNQTQPLIWLQDITERKKSEARLRDLATYDGLTGALNRACWLDTLQHHVACLETSHAPLSILSLDLDHFKTINDTHGHPVGDQALRQLSEITQSILRKEDVLGRMGGEEFGILLIDTSLDDALMIAERVRSLIEHSAIALEAGKQFSFTVSIGLTTAQRDDSIESLLTRVDKALYRAKHTGRNRTAIEV